MFLKLIVAFSRKKGPGWGIIACFTLAFVTTYPVHMYVAEVYLADGDNFTFLFIKYCVGFLFVILVPLIALLLEPDIRAGIRSAQQRQNFFYPSAQNKLQRGCVDVDTFENVRSYM